MKKLTVLLVGLGLSLASLVGMAQKCYAQSEPVVFQTDTLDEGAVIIRQPVVAKTEPEKSFVFAKPDPVDPGKIVGEAFAGSSGALLFGVLGAGLGYALTFDRNRGDWFNMSGVPGAVVGYALTSNLGCALGVYLIGNSGGEKGSFGAALGGSITGSLVGGGLVLLLYKANHNAESPALYYFIAAAAQTTGAVIGFNHSRKKKVQVPLGSLLNLKDGKLSLAIPKVKLLTESKRLTGYKLNLFQAKF